jgi:hypothetical protein
MTTKIISDYYCLAYRSVYLTLHHPNAEVFKGLWKKKSFSRPKRNFGGRVVVVAVLLLSFPKNGLQKRQPRLRRGINASLLYLAAALVSVTHWLAQSRQVGRDHELTLLQG